MNEPVEQKERKWPSLDAVDFIVAKFCGSVSLPHPCLPGPSFQEGILANLMITGKATSFNDRAPKKNSPSSPSGRWGWHKSVAESAYLLQQQRARPCSVCSIVYGKNGLSAVVASTEAPSLCFAARVVRATSRLPLGLRSRLGLQCGPCCQPISSVRTACGYLLWC